jgi:hypothetical protein
MSAAERTRSASEYHDPPSCPSCCFTPHTLALRAKLAKPQTTGHLANREDRIDRKSVQFWWAMRFRGRPVAPFGLDETRPWALRAYIPAPARSVVTDAAVWSYGLSANWSTTALVSALLLRPPPSTTAHPHRFAGLRIFGALGCLSRPRGPRPGAILVSGDSG